MSCIFNILNANSGAITGFATVVLVGITILYVIFTYKLFKLQREQYLLENRPWVFVSNYKFLIIKTCKIFFGMILVCQFVPNMCI